MNLETKYHCSDFESLRAVLQKIGAVSEGIKEQTDYYFNVPKHNPSARMKYRQDGATNTLVYYTRPDFFENKSAQCDFKLFDDAAGALLPLLQEALGVNAVVKKKREQWRKGPAIFHLDEVEGLGKLFEIEYETENPKDDEKTFQELLALFLPFLGTVAHKSNGDMLSKNETSQKPTLP